MPPSARSGLVRGLAPLLLVAAGGCGAFSQAPRIEVESLSLVKVGETDAEADLVVRISGGGPQATILTDFRYSVFLEGRRAFDGRWAALAAAPPEESIVRTLPVVIPGSMLPEGTRPDQGVAIPWSISGSVGWEDPDRLARILLDLGFATPRSGFSGRGDAMSAPPAADEAGAAEAPGGFESIESSTAP